MSHTRNTRRKQLRDSQQHLNHLAMLLGDFYEFLGSSPQPADAAVREHFSVLNDRWKRYCTLHKLMNADHLFVLNVREAWRRHSQQSAKKAQ